MGLTSHAEARRYQYADDGGLPEASPPSKETNSTYGSYERGLPMEEIEQSFCLRMTQNHVLNEESIFH